MRAAVPAPVIAGLTLAAAALATRHAGVPLRDPGHVTVTRLVVASVATAVVALALHRRTGWTLRRTGLAALALGSFFATYFAYRNIKSVVPLLRPHVSADERLGDLDHTLAFGRAPGAVLHDLLGSGFAAHALSDVYLLFFPLIPAMLALALGATRDARAGQFVVTALACAWPLGALSYILLPSIGPFHADPATFAHLPATGAGDLQQRLLASRAAFLADPHAAGAAQSIGAFASLHVGVDATAAIAAQVLGARRAVVVTAWTLTALTAVATIYFGWHYLADDAAGLLIAALAVAIAAATTGVRLRARRSVIAPVPGLA
jgi:hypothetical protein